MYTSQNKFWYDCKVIRIKSRFLVLNELITIKTFIENYKKIYFIQAPDKLLKHIIIK